MAEYNGRRTSEPYQGYEAIDTDDDIRAMFRVKFGIEPREIKRTGGGVLAGPKPEKEGDDAETRDSMAV